MWWQGAQNDLHARKRAADAQRFQLRSPSAPPTFSPTQRFCSLPTLPAPLSVTTAGPWISNGRRTGGAGSCSSCKRARRPYSRVRKGRAAHLQDRAEGPKARLRPQHWRCCRLWPSLYHSRSQEYRSLRARRGAGDSHRNPDWVPIMKRAARSSPIAAGARPMQPSSAES